MLMALLREQLKELVNSLLGVGGLRMVSANWGPRGFSSSLKRVKSQGIIPQTVIDIGASNGQWTRECFAIFPEARYFLVDPLSQNTPSLEKLATQNQKVKYWRGALGSSESSLPLRMHGDQSSLLISEEYGGDIENVPVRTLDSFLKDEWLAGPFLLKADVQGFELEVLRGATKCLQSTELILLEVSFRRIYEKAPLAHEVIAHVASQGFRIYDICSYVLRPYDGELAQADILFAKDGSALFRYEGWN